MQFPVFTNLLIASVSFIAPGDCAKGAKEASGAKKHGARRRSRKTPGDGRTAREGWALYWMPLLVASGMNASAASVI